MSAQMNEVAKRCREMAADIRNWHGKTMSTWDIIHHQVETHPGSELPRMNFEGLVEDFEQLLDEAAAEIERLAALWARSAQIS